MAGVIRLVGGGEDDVEYGQPKSHQGHEAPEVLADGGEDGVGGVSEGAGEVVMVIRWSSLRWPMTDSTAVRRLIWG